MVRAAIQLAAMPFAVLSYQGHPNIPRSAAEAIEELTSNPRVEALILFGSRAFGDHEDRSDIDLAVFGPGISRNEWALLRDRVASARTLYWISLVHLDRNPATLRHRILTTGIVIYAKKTS